MTNVAMNNLWSYIQGLSLSARNKKWLAERLQESSQKAASKAKKEETLISKEEYFRSLDEAEEQYRQGKCKTFDNLDDMNAWLKSL